MSARKGLVIYISSGIFLLAGLELCKLEFRKKTLGGNRLRACHQKLSKNQNST